MRFAGGVPGRAGRCRPAARSEDSAGCVRPPQRDRAPPRRQRRRLDRVPGRPQLPDYIRDRSLRKLHEQLLGETRPAAAATGATTGGRRTGIDGGHRTLREGSAALMRAPDDSWPLAAEQLERTSDKPDRRFPNVHIGLTRGAYGRRGNRAPGRYGLLCMSIRASRQSRSAVTRNVIASCRRQCCHYRSPSLQQMCAFCDFCSCRPGPRHPHAASLVVLTIMRAAGDCLG